MKAKSIAGRSPDEIQAALTQSMGDGFRPTLAMVFASVKQDIHALCEVLERHRIAVYGTSLPPDSDVIEEVVRCDENRSGGLHCK